MDFIKNIHQKARALNKCIVLPEGAEKRTLVAADTILSEGIAKLKLIGNPQEIQQKAAELGLQNISKAEIIDPNNNPKKEDYIKLMLELRASKGLTYEEAAKKIVDPLYLGALMVKAGDADGEVAGAINATGDVLRPAFQYVKTIPGISVVSGMFVMLLPNKNLGDNGVLVFADCAVHPEPNDKELADIARMTARTAKNLVGIEPRVAMLSFSSKGSAKHERVDKVKSALNIVKELEPEIVIDGELQVDAALVPEVGKSKAPGSAVAGNANVLVFPNLESGNIGYKLVQRLAGAEAIGPILQGMAAPINDLSRGCSAEDIVSMVAISAIQAGAQK